MRRIAFTAPRLAGVIEDDGPAGPLAPDEVRGRTLVSLTSPGTELNWGYLATEGFPHHPGYACVFEVEEVGSSVSGLMPGSVVFASGGHAERQTTKAADVCPLPPGLAPERAVFARLMGVSMSTLNTTTARPPAHVLVTGLGPVGNLAAQVFAVCGYEVTAIDPALVRRECARQAGIADVRATVADGPVDTAGNVALHLECSGHEQAVLDGCRTVRKRGEVVLVGVPWKRRTEIYAFEMLHAVFHRYVVLRSGWEWEVPRHSQDFGGGSLAENYAAALGWLADGRVKVGGLGAAYTPEQAQEVYAGLLDQSLPTPAALFDWR